MGAPSTSVLADGSSVAGFTTPAWNTDPNAMSSSGGNFVGVVGNQSAAAWTSAFTAGDLECYMTLVSGIANGTEFYVCLASATVNAHRYLLLFENSTTYKLRRYSDDFTQTQIGAGTQATSAGDKLAIQQVGTSINLWIYTGGSWTQFDSVVDATYSDMAYDRHGRLRRIQHLRRLRRRHPYRRRSWRPDVDPSMSCYLVQEDDGVSRFTLEDGTGFLLLPNLRSCSSRRRRPDQQQAEEL